MGSGPIYYHCAPWGYQPGHIIDAGSFGKFIEVNAGRSQDGNANLYAEALFELARHKYAPTKPSRLKCVFCFEGDQMAAKFIKTMRNGWHVYKVVPTLPNPPFYIGEYTMIRPVSPITPVADALDRVRHYWTADHSQSETREWLLASPVRVTEGPFSVC